MKLKLVIAAMSLAAASLTPTYANTTLTSSFSSITTGALTGTICFTGASCSAGGVFVMASGFNNILPNAPPVPTNPSTGTEVATGLQVGSNGGLGLVNQNPTSDNGEIGIKDGIVLDFASPGGSIPATFGGNSLSSITIKVREDNSGTADWAVYGSTSTTNGSGATLLPGSTSSSGASWGVDAGGNTVITFTINPASGYESYVIALTNGDCSIDLDQIALNYNGVITTTTPEPGTFVMAGIALVGLGVTMKKRSKKA